MTVHDLENLKKDLIREFCEDCLELYHMGFIGDMDLFKKYTNLVMAYYDKIPDRALIRVWDTMSGIPGWGDNPKKEGTNTQEDNIPFDQVYVPCRPNFGRPLMGHFSVKNPEVIDFENLKPKVEYHLQLEEFYSCYPQEHQASFWMIDDDHEGPLEAEHISAIAAFRKFPDQPEYAKVYKTEYGISARFGMGLVDPPNVSGGYIFKYYQGVAYIEGYEPFEAVLLSDPIIHPSMALAGPLKVIKDHPRWATYYKVVAEQTEATKRYYASEEVAAFIERLKNLFCEE